MRRVLRLGLGRRKLEIGGELDCKEDVRGCLAMR